MRWSWGECDCDDAKVTESMSVLRGKMSKSEWFEFMNGSDYNDIWTCSGCGLRFHNKMSKIR